MGPCCDGAHPNPSIIVDKLWTATDTFRAEICPRTRHTYGSCIKHQLIAASTGQAEAGAHP